MIFADKLIALRRQNGWSQEELADRMDVTRQSVSKWESGQALPEIDKILKLSDLFGVSTDYLLKDDIDSAAMQPEQDNPTPFRRRVSATEAETFLAVKEKTSKLIALAAFLCIISPACLLFLGARSEYSDYMSSTAAGCIGIIILVIFVVPAVALFMYCGSKTSQFEYLERELFELDKAASELTEQRKHDFSAVNTRLNITGVCLCILSIVPLFLAASRGEENVLGIALSLPILLFIVAIGVVFFIRAGIINASIQKLLQEGEFSRRRKRLKDKREIFSYSYWMCATVIYLLWSYLSDSWEISWLVWVAAGILFPIYLLIVESIANRRR